MTSAPRRPRLNVNTADPGELLRLPGLTEDFARDIIALRPLTHLKELLLVPGLEPEYYEQIAPYLTVAARVEDEAGVKLLPPPSRRARRRAAMPPAPEAFAPVVEDAPVFVDAPPTFPPPPTEPKREPDIIIVQSRPVPAYSVTPAAPRWPVVVAPPSAGRALFDSYAGPRIVFALFSITMAALVIGFSTGFLNVGQPRVVTVVPASATPDILPTQVELAVAATLAALPTATPLPPTLTATLAPPSPTPMLAVTLNTPLASTGLENTGEQIFYETFIPAGYWDTGENSFSKLSITEGGYLDILMKLPGSIAWATNGFSGQDFYYQGTVRVEACQLGDYYGLLFRFRDENNFYLFGLSCDGRYRLLERVEGEFRPVVDFTFTSAALAGSNTTNLLAVRAEGAQISLYLNDQFVTQANVANTQAGRFGVFAKSAQTSNLLTEFDELSAWQLTPP